MLAQRGFDRIEFETLIDHPSRGMIEQSFDVRA